MGQKACQGRCNPSNLPACLVASRSTGGTKPAPSLAAVQDAARYGAPEIFFVCVQRWQASFSSFCTQTKKGQPARGITAPEFGQLLGTIKRAALKLYKQHHLGFRPLLSYGNDRVHTSPLACLPEHGVFSGRDRLVLPARSPDLHRVIEHSHARLCKQFIKLLHYQSDVLTAGQYIEQLRSLFFKHESVEVISKDVAKLPELYHVVAVEGGYAPGRLC